MAGKFNRGPNVYLTETDLSEVSQPVGTSVGAMVIRANKGPSNQRVFVSRDQELIQIFGEPNPNLGYGIYGALEFLKGSNQLYIVRSTSGTEGYAHAGITTSGSGVWKQILATGSTTLLSQAGYEDGQTPTNNYDIPTNYSFSGEPFVVAALGNGSWGNDLAFSVVTCASPVSGGFDWQYKYDSNPLTDINPVWKKVFKINVFQKPTNILGFNAVSGSPVETFYVSREQITDDNGNNLYLEDVINGISKYIYVKDNASVASTTNPGATTGLIQLLSGTDNSTVSQGNIQSSWGLFNDKEKVVVNMLLCTEPGDKNSTAYPTQLVVGNIAASRKDCIALSQIDGTSSTVTNVNTITANAGYDYNNPSYVALYAGWEMIYDKFNSRNVYIPKNIYSAFLMAKTDAEANVWDAPMGIDRGRISSLGQNVKFNDSQISILRDANINSSKFIQGQGGNFMWMQKTALRKASALSDINVRRLLLFVEGTIINALLPFIGKNNTSKTRLRVNSILKNFLKEVASGGGFNTDNDDGFMVVCDGTNNTSQVIDTNQLVVDVYVKPPRVIEFISLNMIITKTGIDFNELVG